MTMGKTNSSPVVAVWYGQWLWQERDMKGLALRANRKWSQVVKRDGLLFWSTQYIDDAEYEKDYFIRSDQSWEKAFKQIIQFGLVPSKHYTGKTCSCGSWGTYGEDSKVHTHSCSYHDSYKAYLLPEDAPKNNDGLVSCYICSAPTHTVAGRYQLCNNDQCRWYKN